MYAGTGLKALKTIDGGVEGTLRYFQALARDLLDAQQDAVAMQRTERDRFYSLTAAGIRQLKAETAKWTDMAAVVAGILAKKADEI